MQGDRGLAAGLGSFSENRGNASAVPGEIFRIRRIFDAVNRALRAMPVIWPARRVLLALTVY